MADNEFVREWTAEEAAEKGVHEGSVAPRVSNTSGAASGADHRPGIAPATDQNCGIATVPHQVKIFLRGA